MLASKIHQSQGRNLQRTLRKELPIKIGADMVIAEQWRHRKKLSAMSIKKKFWKNILKLMGPYQTTPREPRWLKEHTAMLHYDRNNVNTTVQHHNTLTMSQTVIDLFLKMGDKTRILKCNIQFLKI